MRVRFGDCVLDTATRELTRGGRAVDLEPKVFQLLELLLESRPQALEKDRIHERLWPATFVSESSLPRLVADLRAAIGDQAREPRFIRTLHGFGYAFSGPVTVDSRAAGPSQGTRFRLIWGERSIPLREGENILGRAEDVAVPIDSTRISRHHARIVVSGEQVQLEDLGSKNGTFVAGRRLTGPVPLRDGDEICLGTLLIVFRSAGDASTETDHPS
jgi:DNA-binding winged helix-turn-helix (wHTH) protein